MDRGKCGIRKETPSFKGITAEIISKNPKKPILQTPIFELLTIH
jgi:hypothetical protein